MHRRRQGWGTLGLWLALGAGGLANPVNADGAPSPAAATSLLVVGDTGYPSWAPAGLDLQTAVGDALEEEDRRRPAEALLFLGDNFYPDGLEPGSVVDQIRDELVAPYCWFADLSGPRSGAIRDACAGRERRGRPIRWLAVLGNHDYNTPESPTLSRQEIPRYVANWHLPEGPAEVVELPGLSLILYDSTFARENGKMEPLIRAIRQSRGPWRVLAAHHPLDVSEGTQQILEAVEEAGRPVHLHLAGHEHNLQVAEAESPAIALQVVSGAGGRPRRPKRPMARRHFLYEGAGFVRVDLREDPSASALVATLVAVPPPWRFWSDPAAVACWRIEATLAAQPCASGAGGPGRPTGAGRPEAGPISDRAASGRE